MDALTKAIALPIRSVRNAHSALDARWRLWRLDRYVAALRGATDEAGERFAAMRHLWGNEGWSADLCYLEAVARRMHGVTGPVLECGSGLTTIVAGVLAERRNVHLLSLEQDPSWAAFMQSRLSRFRISTVTVMHAPLVAYEGFLWFDVRELKLPESFELVICDGPAINGQQEPYQSAWRVGLIPVLRERAVEVGEVLMDDADDQRASALRTRWEDEYGLHVQVANTSTGEYLIARSALRKDTMSAPR